jgi:23S rRNA (adenine2030-N6)-methyltransferase
MLGYRHHFHAGNAADTLKHMVLIFCLDYLRRKETPFLCVDTHGGRGLYRLDNREWEGGLGRLLGAEGLPPMAERYLRLCLGEAAAEEKGPERTDPEQAAGPGPAAETERPGGKQAAGEVFLYRGSPAIMKALLRPGDRLVCFELHPGDYPALKEFLAGPPRGGGSPGVKPPAAGKAEARKEDGPGGLKGLLPPPSGRGLILIDPAWELKSDYGEIPRRLGEALKRFPQGIYILWYPLLKKSTGEGLPEALEKIHPRRRCRVELYTPESANSPRGMYGSGLFIYNPPWTLKGALEETLPVLASRIGTGGGGWTLRWEPGV